MFPVVLDGTLINIEGQCLLYYQNNMGFGPQTYKVSKLKKHLSRRVLRLTVSLGEVISSESCYTLTGIGQKSRIILM